MCLATPIPKDWPLFRPYLPYNRPLLGAHFSVRSQNTSTSRLTKQGEKCSLLTSTEFVSWLNVYSLRIPDQIIFKRTLSNHDSLYVTIVNITLCIDAYLEEESSKLLYSERTDLHWCPG